MNEDIKIAMIRARLRQYQLANLLGIHEGNLSKMLNRQKLSTEEKERILAVIKKYKEGNCK